MKTYEDEVVSTWDVPAPPPGPPVLRVFYVVQYAQLGYSGETYWTDFSDPERREVLRFQDKEPAEAYVDKRIMPRVRARELPEVVGLQVVKRTEEVPQ